VLHQWAFKSIPITNKELDKPVGDWISAPSTNFVAMATRVVPKHFSWFHWIGHPRKVPGRPKHLRSICHTSRLISDFAQSFGSKFWALGGLNQTSKKENSSVEGIMENWRPKMARFHRETKKKKQFEVCDRQTDIRTDRQSQLLTIIDPRLGAEIKKALVRQYAASLPHSRPPHTCHCSRWPDANYNEQTH